MATVAEKRAAREKLLVAYYLWLEEHDEPGAIVWIEKYLTVAEDAGIDRALAESETQWLADRGLVRHPVFGEVLELTPAGRDEAERLLDASGSVEASVAGLVMTDEARLFLEQVVKALHDLADNEGIGLTEDDRDDLHAQAETINAQRRSPRPRAAVSAWAIRAATWTIDNAGAELVGAGTLALLQRALHMLGV